MNFIAIKNSSLKSFNTLKLDSYAELMVFPLNEIGLQEIYVMYGKQKKIIILGKGSNVLFSKKYYDSTYVFLSLKFMDKMDFKNSQIIVEAGATLSNLSWFALENNIGGYEFLEDVPGSIGGAIVMNAGTYSENIGQLIEHVTYYNIETDEIVQKKVGTEDFGRRESEWSNNQYVLLSCSMKTQSGDYLESLDKLLNIKRNRYLKQPRNYPNAGSVFKRPTLNGKDFFVWKLFSDLNLRGHRINDAMISEKHPGFIINMGNATFKDIKYLIDLASEKVKLEYNIDLELEWKII